MLNPEDSTRKENTHIMANFHVWMIFKENFTVSFEEEKIHGGCCSIEQINRPNNPTTVKVFDSRSPCDKWRLTALQKIDTFMQSQTEDKNSSELEISFCEGCDSVRLWKNNVLSPCGNPHALIRPPFQFWVCYKKNYTVYFEEEKIIQHCCSRQPTKRPDSQPNIRVFDTRSDCRSWRKNALQKIDTFMREKDKKSPDHEIGFCRGCDSICLWKNSVLNPCCQKEQKTP